MKPLSIVILAAGMGTRMRSNLPKPLHPIGGRPMLDHVINSARALNPQKLIVVYGHKGELLQEAFSHHKDLIWAEQKTFNGTGDAMRYALPFCGKDHNVLVLYGDTPLINPTTLKTLVAKLEEAPLSWLTALSPTPFGYGRIIRDNQKKMVAIVEEKDATTEEKEIQEINTGIFTTTVAFLQKALPKLTNQNSQREYYLTDIASIAVREGLTISTSEEDAERIQGVNDRLQLANLEAYYQKEKAKELMLNGITLEKPESLTIQGTVQNGFDCVIGANVTLKGQVILGQNVKIGTGSCLKNVVIGDNTTIEPYSIIENATIENDASIGPFARLREGSHIHEGAKVGNFVETKQTTLGKGSKANHLSYIGDSEIGEKVNIGAGTITCNYDGANKFKTIIKDEAFIGSNSALVAPVTIGKQATVAAGTTLTKDVADYTLALNKLERKEVSSWERPKKKKPLEDQEES